MKGFYVGLWYGPTISEVSEFQVGVLGETKRVLPSIGGSGLFGSNKFDWHVERDPIISFKKSNLHGLRGGLGYSAYGVRIEAEFDHERGTLSSSGRGGGAFLLPKTASISLLADPPDGEELSATLQQFTEEELSNFEQYL